MLEFGECILVKWISEWKILHRNEFQDQLLDSGQLFKKQRELRTPEYNTYSKDK